MPGPQIRRGADLRAGATRWPGRARSGGRSRAVRVCRTTWRPGWSSGWPFRSGSPGPGRRAPAPTSWPAVPPPNWPPASALAGVGLAGRRGRRPGTRRARRADPARRPDRRGDRAGGRAPRCWPAATRSAGSTATWWPARVERLGAIALVERAAAPTRSRAGRRRRLDGLRAEGLGLLTWGPSAVALRRAAGLLPPGARRAVAGRRRRGAAGSGRRSGSDRSWPGPQPRRPGPGRRRGRAAPAAALAGGGPAGRGGAGAAGGAERIAGPGGLSRPRRAGAGGEGAGGVRLAARPGLADGRVPVLLHLLSPAGPAGRGDRDLASFWRTGTRRCGPSCAADTRATPGPRTRPAPPTRRTGRPPGTGR